MPHPWTPAEDAMLATMTPGEIHKATGRSLKAIGKRRVKLKRKGAKLPDLRRSEQRTNIGRSIWTPEADELVHRLRPFEVARLLGVSKATARRRRASLGLPPVGRHRKPPRAKRPKARWTEAEVLIVLTLPPDEAEAKLPRRSASAIHTLRCRLRRQDVRLPTGVPRSKT